MSLGLLINILMQALVTVHVKHGYVCMQPMTDKKWYYMGMEATKKPDFESGTLL